MSRKSDYIEELKVQVAANAMVEALGIEILNAARKSAAVRYEHVARIGVLAADALVKELYGKEKEHIQEAPKEELQSRGLS